MKGLLLKDLYVIKWQGLILLPAAVIFSMCGGDMLVSYAALIASTIAYTSIAYDENCKWDRYALTLPCSVKQIVLSKYLLNLLSIASAAAVMIICTPIRSAISGAPFTKWSLINIITVCLVSFTLGCISIVFVFRFGALKGRFIVIAIMMVSMCLLSLVITDSSSNIDFVNKITAIAAAVSVVIIPLTYFLSVKAYKHN